MNGIYKNTRDKMKNSRYRNVKVWEKFSWAVIQLINLIMVPIIWLNVQDWN